MLKKSRILMDVFHISRAAMVKEYSMYLQQAMEKHMGITVQLMVTSTVSTPLQLQVLGLMGDPHSILKNALECLQQHIQEHLKTQ